jgi:hypothetical protein
MKSLNIISVVVMSGIKLLVIEYKKRDAIKPSSVGSLITAHSFMRFDRMSCDKDNGYLKSKEWQGRS